MKGVAIVPAYPSRKCRKIAPGPDGLAGPRAGRGHLPRALIGVALMAPLALAVGPLLGLPGGRARMAAEVTTDPRATSAQEAAQGWADGTTRGPAPTPDVVRPQAEEASGLRPAAGRLSGAIADDAYPDQGCGLPEGSPVGRAEPPAGTAGDAGATLHLALRLTFGRDTDARDIARGRQLLTDLMSGASPHIQATAMALLAQSRLERRGDEKEAARLIDRSLSLEPDNAFAQAALATLLLRTHDEAGAEAALRAAISAAPDWAPFYSRLADLKDSLRQTDEARALRLAAARAGAGRCFVAR